MSSISQNIRPNHEPLCTVIGIFYIDRAVLSFRSCNHQIGIGKLREPAILDQFIIDLSLIKEYHALPFKIPEILI